MRHLLALCLLCGVLAAEEGSGDRIEADRWYVGDLNGKPAVSLHTVTVLHGDGARTVTSETAMVLMRSLDPGNGKSRRPARLEIREQQCFDEDAKGVVRAFRFDHEDSGSRSTATGRIEAVEGGGAHAIATVHHLGRKQEVDLPLPGEVISDRRLQELLGRGEFSDGEAKTSVGLGFLQERVVVMQVTDTFRGFDDQGRRRFDQIADVVPIPMQLTVTAKGELATMAMSLGVIKLELRASDGPVSLLGAEIPTIGLVGVAGKPPAAAPRNRYRLPAEGHAAEDEFQHAVDGTLEVSSEAAPAPLDDPKPFLAAEAQIETDDAELRKWVADTSAGHTGDPAALAEQLRLAVRAYLTPDLEVGDGTALQAFRDRHGDCTEHAALLCAALRIAGIPARIEVGIVYAPDYGGWVGHAWNSAYLKDRWVHLDSAYPGRPRSCYIKLANGSGEDAKPAAALLANLSSLAGKQVETLP